MQTVGLEFICIVLPGFSKEGNFFQTLFLSGAVLNNL